MECVISMFTSAKRDAILFTLIDNVPLKILTVVVISSISLTLYSYDVMTNRIKGVK